MNRAELLQDFIGRADGPVRWGVDDCTMWSATWVRAVSGRSVATLEYHSEEAARLLIERHGGLLSIWDRALGDAGFFESYDPTLGDVGLVDTRLCGPVGVIFGGGGLALRRKADGGVWVFSTARRALIKAWTI
ncbi:DUF6950 family protein [Aminobacter aminovorans]|uniref:DUF6950 family protein n=1 Tax=Aminobacter aminovorans TaxID=83263 RepID=UPI0028567CBC|nr:hypothetical protein [Aminobacter aminovorans]MDR7220362.1 hypothetical protein [Aminobacter aminovorans]